jgi:iron complex outermembrane receptor protein
MKRTSYHLFASMLALGAAMPAFAQTPAQPAPQTAPQGADQDRRASDVIVVTANKRQESVQDVAVAVTAVTAETKQEYGVISVTDLTNVTPGLSYTPGNERVTLRGIGRLTNSFGADPGVANYNDGIYTAFAVFAGKNPLLIDRVEVLRGPQGTLYGRNAIGGAINTVSKRPTDDFKSEVLMGVGNYDARQIGVSVSGPITDWLRYRVAGTSEYRGGIDPDYGEGGELVGWEINDNYLEGQLEGDIGDRFSWWFKVADLNYDKEGPPGGRTATFSSAPYFLGTSPTAANTFNSGGYNPAFPYTGNPAIISYTATTGRKDNPFATNGEHAYNTNKQNKATLNAYDEYILEGTYSFDNFDLKYVGGYTFYDYKLVSDPDGTPVKSVTYNAQNPTTGLFAPVAIGTPGSGTVTINPDLTNIYGESRSAFSNEINLISTNDSPLQWILGAYQYQDNQNQPSQQQYYLDEARADFVFRGAGLVANPGRRTQRFSNTSIQYAYGVFAQVDYNITDEIKLTGGLRWSADLKKSLEQAYLVLPYTTVLVAGVAGTAFFDATASQYGAIAANFGGGIDPLTGFAYRRLRGSWDAITGVAGVEWSPTADTLVFGKYSRGYKAGGFNNIGFGALPYTDPEFVNSYEGGWKQEWSDLNLTTNTAAFYYDYEDAQVPLTQIRDFGTPQQTAFVVFANVPKVRTYGVELESTWRPIDNLDIGFTYSYLNSTVQSDDVYTDATKDGRCVNNAPGGVTPVTCGSTPAGAPGPATVLVDPLRNRSVEGNQMGQSPLHKASLNFGYRLEQEDGSYWFPTLSVSWRDIFYDSFFNDPIEKSPSYFNVDSRLNWYSPNETFSLTFWVRNLLDDEAQSSVTGSFRAADFKLYENPSYTPPRMFGVDFRMKLE